MHIELLEKGQGDKHLEKGQGYLSRLTDNHVTSLVFWYCCHVCGEVILVKDHIITVHLDNKISIDPSLVCPTETCNGHYWIKNNEIQ